MSLNDRLRELPSVDEVLKRLDSRCPRELLVYQTRRTLDKLRDRVRAGDQVDIASIQTEILAALTELERPSLRRVINATGVVLHTNLGRAPLPDWTPLRSYSNLEYDLKTGRRGKRDVHVGGLLERLTGKPGIVVNNNAGAVFLALHEIAAGAEVIVSRGELIEIGDGFRIPDIMTGSGAILREVGTTNRTRIEDYADAITDRTRLILRVHPSNFNISGFTAKPTLGELSALAHERGIQLYEDLGSGCLVDLKPYGINEPTVGESLLAGVNLVSFSGDKLLGGPQSGMLAGDEDLIARLRRNPMFRALRPDKLILQVLETTLRHLLFCQWDRIPALRMLTVKPEYLRERAESFAAKISGAQVLEGVSVAGGGSTPDQTLPAWLVGIDTEDPNALAERLRKGDPAIVARIEHDRLVIDLRTVLESEEEELAVALQAPTPAV